MADLDDVLSLVRKLVDGIEKMRQEFGARLDRQGEQIAALSYEQERMHHTVSRMDGKIDRLGERIDVLEAVNR